MASLDVPLTVHLLRVETETLTPLALPAPYGPKLRGALFEALRARFCANRASPSCAACELHAACPISRLAATVNDDSVRGRETPRPFVLRPPAELPAVLPAGRQFSFELGLFGDGVQMFPYVVHALLEMGATGVGNRGAAPGRFAVRRMIAFHPFRGAERVVYAAESKVARLPSVPVTQEEVRTAAESLPSDGVRLRFVTPLRVKSQGEWMRRPALGPIIQRVQGRLGDLTENFAPYPARGDFRGLNQHAALVRTVEDSTRWVSVESHSSRTGVFTALGGLVGEARFAGDLGPLRELLVWSTLVSVGKSTTRGDGVIQIPDWPAVALSRSEWNTSTERETSRQA